MAGGASPPPPQGARAAPCGGAIAEREGKNMPLYLVTVSRVVREILSNDIEIDAPDAATAQALALAQWEAGEIELYETPSYHDAEPEPVEAFAREVAEP